MHKRADCSTHVYTFFSPQFDIRHTYELVAVMELVNQKAPPALQKLREHAPKPEEKENGPYYKGHRKEGKGNGRDVDTGFSVSARSEHSSPKAVEGYASKALHEDGDRTWKHEPPWKTSGETLDCPGPERRGDASRNDRKTYGNHGGGKSDGKGKGAGLHKIPARFPKSTCKGFPEVPPMVAPSDSKQHTGGAGYAVGREKTKIEEMLFLGELSSPSHLLLLFLLLLLILSSVEFSGRST